MVTLHYTEGCLVIRPTPTLSKSALIQMRGVSTDGL